MKPEQTVLRARANRRPPIRFKHGHCPNSGGSPTYQSWAAMRARCYRKSHAKFESYGAKGIRVCDRWLHSFENFLADMGERPTGTTIDRIDNNGNYDQSNCRWATPKEQYRNRACTAVMPTSLCALCVSRKRATCHVTHDRNRFSTKCGQKIYKTKIYERRNEIR